jgi:hypothetical protein
MPHILHPFIVLGRRNGITALRVSAKSTLAYTRIAPKSPPAKQQELFDIRFVSTQFEPVYESDSFEALKHEFFATITINKQHKQNIKQLT